MRVPIRLQASAITGIGDVAGDMLANARIEGWLSVTPKLVRADGLRLTSAKWSGKLSLLIDLVTGGEIAPEATVLYAHLGGQPALNGYSALFS